MITPLVTVQPYFLELKPTEIRNYKLLPMTIKSTTLVLLPVLETLQPYLLESLGLTLERMNTASTGETFSFPAQEIRPEYSGL